ncbi:MAG: HEPN domain-containing protein [Nitrospinae bacterium]|nr:HEPN domain-containing protein [Nitrospinota bacterium]MBI3814535.1 HEPN domain-containing protein [Nitrospinota bacterium]
MDKSVKDTISAQLSKAEEKLHASRDLLEKGYLDDAISRAYYAMFHAASAVLLAEGITIESHSGLKTMFGLRLIKTGKIDKAYAKALDKLKDERENGDYDIFTSFDREDAEKDIKEAELFLAEMKRYLKKEKGLV